MPKLWIDEREVEVPPGSTVLDAAARLGIGIPTLCFLPGHSHLTSCMLCVVAESRANRLLPSCSVPAQDGMRIDTASAAVRAARRAALELLLSEHAGDCEAPCRRLCPAFMNIPRMLRQIAAGRHPDALQTVMENIPLPGVLGRICPAPCEKGCRRGQHDKPVSVCLLKRFTADHDAATVSPWLPPRAPASGRHVAVVGTGPAGLTAAYYLLRLGHACTLLDDRDLPGGKLRSDVPPEALPRAVLDAEIERLRRLGAVFRQRTRLGVDVQLPDLLASHDAVILAMGKPDPDLLATLGVAASAGRIATGADGLQTCLPRVFAGGDAVRATRLAVRAVNDGRRLALAVHALLTGTTGRDARDRFNSALGRLDDGELAEFIRGADPHERVEPARGLPAGLTTAEAMAEARRCLHCDCRKADSCALRRYADEYDVEPARRPGTARLRTEIVRTHPDLVFEPGKCIKCGRCISIAAQAGDRPGLAFLGRGFEARVGVPFGDSLANALTVSARACVQACPTGALAWTEEEAP